MLLVAIIGKHQAYFFSLQPLSVKETKSGSIMFKKMWQYHVYKNMTVSCLQKHDSIIFAKNLTVSCVMKCCHVGVTTLSAVQCHVCLKDGRTEDEHRKYSG